MCKCPVCSRRPEGWGGGAGGSPTMLSCGPHGEDGALYPKSSRKVLKGFKPHEQMGM